MHSCCCCCCCQDAGGGEKEDEQGGGEKDDQEKDDNAVDMKEDFDGQVEDVPEGEGEDQDSEEEESNGVCAWQSVCANVLMVMSIPFLYPPFLLIIC